MNIRKYKIHLAGFVILILLLLTLTHSGKKTKKANLKQKNEEYNKPTLELSSPEASVLRMAHARWIECMEEGLDDERKKLELPTEEYYAGIKFVKKTLEDEPEADELQKLMLEKFDKTWYLLDKLTESCRKSTDLWHVEPEVFSEKLIRYITPNDNTTTSFIRFGLGGDLSVEKHFQQKLNKQSEFFGVDPMYEINSEIYRKFGTYFPFAIGGTSAMLPAIVTDKNGKKVKKLTPHISLDVFVKDFVRKSLVDYTIFEGEGSEFEILEHFSPHGTLANSTLTLCQVNLEMHRPKEITDNRKANFVKNILDLVRGGTYVIHSATNLRNLKLYLLNVVDEECANKYLFRYLKNQFE